MENENEMSRMDDFLYRLKNIDKKLSFGRKDADDLLTKIEFTFIMISNNMGYLDDIK